MNNTYTPNSADIVAPNTTNALSEFYGFLGDCGQAAATVFKAILQGTTPTSTDLNSMVRDMVSHGTASAQGVTSLSAIQGELRTQGIQTSIWDDWKSAINGMLGKAPTELFLNNAGALPGETPGLQGHFVTVVGYSPSAGKYIVSDPNTQAAKNGQFVLYSQNDLAKAGAGQALAPVSSTITSVGNGITNGVGNVLGAPINTAFDHAIKVVVDAFGANNLKDFTIRGGLIVVGVILIFIGVIVLATQHAANTLEQNKELIMQAAAMAG